MIGFIRKAIERVGVNSKDVIQTVHDEAAVNSAAINALKAVEMFEDACDSICWPHVVSGLGKKIDCKKVSIELAKKF